MNAKLTNIYCNPFNFRALRLQGNPSGTHKNKTCYFFIYIKKIVLILS